MASLSHALQTREEAEQFYCTIETCDLSWSYWGYLPSLPANALFLALFALSTIIYIGQGVIARKKFLGFSIAMISGCLLEVIGYIGRVMAHKDPFAENPFLIQIICLTIAPAFMAAGIYLCLSRIVLTFGPSNSRIAPLSYPRIFIPCDALSLVLQAAGGGMASVATHTNQDPTMGNNIMIAGLAVQVFTLLIFIILAADFAYRTISRVKSLGSSALDPRYAALRHSFKFKGFLFALSFATICIFTRSVYRVAELSEGWKGHLILTQKYFIALEGAIVGAAVLALNAFHPGMCFGVGYVRAEGEGGCCGRKRKGRRDGESGEVGVVEEHVGEK